MVIPHTSAPRVPGHQFQGDGPLLTVRHRPATAVQACHLMQVPSVQLIQWAGFLSGLAETHDMAQDTDQLLSACMLCVLVAKPHTR